MMRGRRSRLALPTLPRLSLRRRPEIPPALEPTDTGPVLVLSGGARLGAVQIGIIRALYATGFRPAAVVGTSAGAFNAAFLAFHPDDTELAGLSATWEEIRFHRIFNRNYLRMLYNAAIRKDHVVGNQELRAALRRHLQPDDFAAARLGLHIVATNLGSGEKTVISSGSISDAVLASAAIPGFFPPVQIDGQLYVDGAVTANLDLETAVALGARRIVAIDVSASVVPAPTRAIGPVLARSLEIVLRERTFATLERLQPRADITLIRPGPLTMHRLGGITTTRDLIAESHHLGDELVTKALNPSGGFLSGLISTEPLPPMGGFSTAT